ncbi:hypothetical protein N7471_010442 [Penicillium samsonianum]|uniref:uncharacterized protein n=1 Tax=Penicillium samsonianum TaxID=1882272 RepID=UPI002546647A|nr:uncharacterized protein N7471_010442 [Penicillium samsonianum]KAJ6125949.1 hypothetical protein N7471_010442 [Penicillium samsonianum]
MNQRYIPTGLWFIESTQFGDWLTKTDSFLLVHGPQGCGKSFLCGTALEYVAKQHRCGQSSVGIGIASFFFDDNLPQESKQDDTDMLRSLLWNLSDQLRDNHEHLHKLVDHRQELSSDSLRDLLLQILGKFSQAFILIDGLDKSLSGTEVLKTIDGIRKSGLPVHLLVTSPDDPDIKQSIQADSNEVVTMSNDGVLHDISNKVTHELITHVMLKTYYGEHENTHSAITERAKYGFRHAMDLVDILKEAYSMAQLNSLRARMSLWPSAPDAARKENLA